MTEPVSAGRVKRLLSVDFDNPAAGGLLLMLAAALALGVANSPIAPMYFGALASYAGPLSVGHWINDGLMAMFFLFVGLEIKREVLEGQLSTWSGRVLPGLAAVGGMAAPAAVFVFFTWGDDVALRGWAIPAATDIAFALGVLALLGSRVPPSLKVFLTALAIIDDLGAVLVIALFYTSELSLPDLAGAAVVIVVLWGMNRAGIVRLWPYMLLGLALWVFVLRSGVHATLAGVMLAFTVPLRAVPDQTLMAASPLHRLEHILHSWVMFGIVPIFGFANAGVSFAGLTMASLGAPVTLGVAAGLLLGKLFGVFGVASLAIRLRLAAMPAGAGWVQLLGVSLLCGIGFTMSLFIGALAFAGSPAIQDAVKLGILAGSLAAGFAGWGLLRAAPQPTLERRSLSDYQS